MFDTSKLSAAQSLLEAQKIAFGPVIFQAARLLRDWGIFELLSNSDVGLTVQEISHKLDISNYAVEVLCESGFSMGALKLKNELYTITTIGYFLLNDEMTKINMNFIHDINYQGLFYFEQALKTQKPSGLHQIFSKKETIYPILSKLPQQAKKSWFEFDHFYSDAAFKKLVNIISKRDVNKLLELGGNTGKWSIALAKASKNTKITIIDYPGQIDIALKNALSNGVIKQIDAIALDLLNHDIDFPKDFDGVWMSQFLDCFAPSDIIALLKRSKNALSDNGKIYIVEPFWDKQSHEIGAYCLINTTPYFTALANGVSKMYKYTDFEKFIAKAGLQIVEHINNLGFGHTLIVCQAIAI